MKITPTRADDIRCPACNALLARREGGVIAIRRNDLQVSFAGDGTRPSSATGPRAES